MTIVLSGRALTAHLSEDRVAGVLGEKGIRKTRSAGNSVGLIASRCWLSVPPSASRGAALDGCQRHGARSKHKQRKKKKKGRKTPAAFASAQTWRASEHHKTNFPPLRIASNQGSSLRRREPR